MAIRGRPTTVMGNRRRRSASAILGRYAGGNARPTAPERTRSHTISTLPATPLPARLRRTAIAVLIAAGALLALGGAERADAATCSTPRTVGTSFGPAIRIEAGLCELALKPGANVLRWDRSASTPEQAFGTLDFGVVQSAFSVWHFDSTRRVWSGWGPASPSGVSQIEALEGGEIYFLDAPTAATWELPANASIFEGRQVVSFYGFPGIPFMGALGLYSPSGAITAVGEIAAQYDAVNGELDVVPAVHPIVAVAQTSPNADGTYLGRMDASVIAGYVEAARAADALVFLDVQIGWSDPLAEVQLLEPFLREPFVHLALDPEFATAIYDAVPGSVIGSLGAEDLNRVQAYLAELVREEGIPPKALVLHQFNGIMLLDPTEYDDVAEVEIVVDMDGFGGPEIKTRHYGFYALAPYSEVPAIKLFFDWDVPLMSPTTIQNLSTPPGLIIYQ